MSNKNVYQKERDGLQQGIYRVINPIVRLLIRMGVTPNMVTTIGLLGNIASAIIIAYAGYESYTTGSPRFDLITIAGVVTIVFSLFDMLDGQVARLGNMVSRFGALYDSVLDRYCELFTVGALSYYLIMNGYVIGALIAFLALVGSVMVSYVRARAEGVGLECKVGFMQRPERVVVTSIGCGLRHRGAVLSRRGQHRIYHPHCGNGCDSRFRQPNRFRPCGRVPQRSEITRLTHVAPSPTPTTLRNAN